MRFVIGVLSSKTLETLMSSARVRHSKELKKKLKNRSKEWSERRYIINSSIFEMVSVGDARGPSHKYIYDREKTSSHAHLSLNVRESPSTRYSHRTPRICLNEVESAARDGNLHHFVSARTRSRRVAVRVIHAGAKLCPMARPH